MYRQFAMDFKPVSPRICSIRIKGKSFNYTLISCHAPSEASDEHEKKEFYDSLENTIRLSPAADIKIIGGDFEAELGKETVHAGTLGMHSLHNLCNDNGHRLINFCASQNLIIGSTLFAHKNIHKGTWFSPDGLTVKQIDHVLFSAQYKYILQDVRVFRGANFASDHYLSTAKIRSMLLVFKNKKGKRAKKVNTAKLKAIPSESQTDIKVEDMKLPKVEQMESPKVEVMESPKVDDMMASDQDMEPSKVEDMKPSFLDNSET